MQRIGSISKWSFLAAAHAVEFTSTKHRRVRVEVNSPEPTRLYLINDDGETFFLARVLGLDVIEFEVNGAFQLLTEDSGINWWSADNTSTHTAIPEAEAFVKLHEAREKNYEVLLMERVMQQNIERRMRHIHEELERKYEQREAQRLAAESPKGADSGKPAPASGREPSDPHAAPAGKGGDGDDAETGEDA